MNLCVTLVIYQDFNEIWYIWYTCYSLRRHANTGISNVVHSCNNSMADARMAERGETLTPHASGVVIGKEDVRNF
jgi:hypothetical protein